MYIVLTFAQPTKTLTIPYTSDILLQATAEANNLAAVSSAKSQYLKEMEEVGHMSR